MIETHIECHLILTGVHKSDKSVYMCVCVFAKWLPMWPDVMSNDEGKHEPSWHLK